MAKSEIAQEGNILAISKAADISAADLIDKINTFWIQNLRQEHAFDVNIQGDNFLARFIALKQKLKQIPGIENMQPREMGSDYAVIQVFYKGKAAQFADMIMLKTFESFGLEISDVSDNFINIRFIEKGQPPLSENDSQDIEEIMELNPDPDQEQNLETSQ